MTQPHYVPIARRDRVRPVERLPAPAGWTATRPADQRNAVVPVGPRFGSTGPDLGYGLKLARRFEDRLELTEGERAEDALAGCFAVGSRRAALFGRAPVIYDMELAYTVWGYLGGAPGGAPADLLLFRKPLFQGASHDYWVQRDIAGRVKPEALRLTPAEARQRLADWQGLIAV